MDPRNLFLQSCILDPRGPQYLHILNKNVNFDIGPLWIQDARLQKQILDPSQAPHANIEMLKKT